MIRLLALAASLALVPSCAAPRTAIITGAVGAIAGGVVVHQAFDQPDKEGFVVGVFKAGVESTAGVAMITAGAALVIAGLVGLGQEAEQQKPPLGPLAQAPMTMEASFAPPSSASAMLAARTDQLRTQLQLEARAGHCDAATVLARRLALLDRARTIALIEGDAQVSSCVAVQL